MALDPLTDSDIRALETEREAFNLDEESQARRVFQRNLVPAATTICQMAVYSSNERLRLQAATYVVERGLGRVQDNPPAPPHDPFKELLGSVVTELGTDGVEQLRKQVTGVESGSADA